MRKFYELLVRERTEQSEKKTRGVAKNFEKNKKRQHFMPMLVHSVYFFLKPELSAEQRAEFRNGVETLKTCRDAQRVFVGTPAPVPERAVLEKSYAVGLNVIFKDMAAHDAYQVDPIHKAFLEKFKGYWSKVQVYDTL